MNIEKINAVSKMTGIDEFDVANVLICADYFDMSCKKDADCVADSLRFFGETYLQNENSERNGKNNLLRLSHKEPYSKRGEDE